MSLFISNISNSGIAVIPMFWCITKQLVLPTNFAFAASGNTQHLDTSRSRAKLCWTLWVGWLLAAILMRRHHMTLNLFRESIIRKHIWCVCQALQLKVPNWKFCSFALEHCIIFHPSPMYLAQLHKCHQICLHLSSPHIVQLFCHQLFWRRNCRSWWKKMAVPPSGTEKSMSEAMKRNMHFNVLKHADMNNWVPQYQWEWCITHF